MREIQNDINIHILIRREGIKKKKTQYGEGNRGKGSVRGRQARQRIKRTISRVLKQEDIVKYRRGI